MKANWLSLAVSSFFAFGLIAYSEAQAERQSTNQQSEQVKEPEQAPNIRIDQIEERFWLVDSNNKPFFAHGITHIGTKRAEFDYAQFSTACKKLGFNAYGYGCPAALRSDMPYLESWNHLVPISLYRGDTHNFIDIFDPKEQARIEKGIKANCERGRDTPN